MKKRFMISSQLFQGFEMEIEDEDVKCIKDIINIIQTRLIDEMERLGLFYLVEKAKQTTFHHHSYDFIDLLQDNDPDKIWYICDHV